MAVIQNHLIQRLPKKDRNTLLALCEPVDLVLADVICEAGATARHVYFPLDGFISTVAMVDGTPGVEVGMVGREGMLGAEVALGVPAALLHSLVQGAGSALRVGMAPFSKELRQNDALRKSTQLYLYVLIAQLANSAACSRFHTIGPRLARWLLMTQDRAHSERFRVTQEFLSYMLGVRRVGITVAAGQLQRAGLIEYRRGDFRIIDRRGLEHVACACYSAGEEVYASMLN